MNGERPCEICGGSSQTLLYEVDGYPIVRCSDCDLVFVGASTSPERLIALYDESYYEDPDQIGYDGYGQAEARKRHHDRSLLTEIEELRAPGEMLEIGCAYGFFLDEARARGWRVRGIEPSAYAAQRARERFGLDVVTDAFTELAAEQESVDVVALWDVIEHLPNPRETLELVHEWLRPHGVLALSTGNITSLSARLHGPDWSLMSPPWHQFYFSRPTLRRLLRDVGFESVRIDADGSVAIDPASSRPRIGRRSAGVLAHPLVTGAARRLGAGTIMFVFARRT